MRKEFLVQLRLTLFLRANPTATIPMNSVWHCLPDSLAAAEADERVDFDEGWDDSQEHEGTRMKQRSVNRTDR